MAVNIGYNTGGGGTLDLASLQNERIKMKQAQQQQQFANFAAIADAYAKNRVAQEELKQNEIKTLMDFISKASGTTSVYRDEQGRPVTVQYGSEVPEEYISYAKDRLNEIMSSGKPKSKASVAGAGASKKPVSIETRMQPPSTPIAPFQQSAQQQGFPLRNTMDVLASFDQNKAISPTMGIGTPQEYAQELFGKVGLKQPSTQGFMPYYDQQGQDIGNMPANMTGGLSQDVTGGLPPWAMGMTIGKGGKVSYIKSNASSRDYGLKEEQYKAKRIQQMGDDLDWNKNVRSAYGVTAQGFHRAERLGALVERYKDLNLDQREMEELAIGLNAILSGSNQSAQEQVRGLIPKSAIGNFQKLKEWISNNPQGTNQQEFVKRMYGDVKREEDTMYNQLLRDARQKISKYGDIEKKYPDEWSNMLQTWGIDPEGYKQWRDSGYKKTSVIPGKGIESEQLTTLKSKYGLQ